MPSSGRPCPLKVQMAPAIGRSFGFTTSPFKSCVGGNVQAFAAKTARTRRRRKSGRIEVVFLPTISGPLKKTTQSRDESSETLLPAPPDDGDAQADNRDSHPPISADAF